MQIGDIVKLSMNKILKKDMEFDNEEYFAEVLSYDEEEQLLLLGCAKEVLMKISLEARYSCSTQFDDHCISCLGIVRERYDNEEGSVIRFYIENGFYKVMLPEDK